MAKVEGSLDDFQWLAEQNRLHAGQTPSCVKLGEVFPDFTETATAEENVPHFNEDGVFIHKLRFYLPGQYCVDGEMDTGDYQYQYEGDNGRGVYTLDKYPLYHTLSFLLFVCGETALTTILSHFW